MTDDIAITFTVVGYQYHFEWEVFINCLLLQTDPRWKCDIWHDGPDKDSESICQRYVREYPQYFTYNETPERLNDWGHSMRDIGLKNAQTKYWSTQNADNYLMPTFVEYTLEALEQGIDMVIFPCVHNYVNVNPPKSPPYSVLRVAPKANRCDAGSLVIRTDLAQQVGWNHRYNEADGAFINEVMSSRPRPKVVTLPNVLMVHN